MADQTSLNNYEKRRQRADIAITQEERMSYLPEDYGMRLPKKGGWIFIKIIPPTEIKVPLWSIWYAIEDTLHNRKGEDYKIKILTTKGELWIVPGEYGIIQDITKYIALVGEEIDLHFIGENAEIDQEKIFYMMSRGLSRKDAILLLLPKLESRNICYMQPKPHIQKILTKAFIR